MNGRSSKRIGWIVLIGLVAGLLAATGCATTGATATAPASSPQVAAVSESDVPLISRDVLFGDPERAAARLSPDGRWLSFLAPSEGYLNVWVAPADSPKQARPITHDAKRGIRMYFWAYAPDTVLYVQDEGGDENFRVYSANAATGEVRDLTPLTGVRATIDAVSPTDPSHIVIGLNDRDPSLHDPYLLDLATGERTLILENPGFVGFLFDDDYRLRFAIQPAADGGFVYLTPGDDGGWTPFATIDSDDALTTHLIGFDKTGDVVYLLDSRGRNTAALFTLNTKTGAVEKVAEDPQADISGVMINPTTYAIEAAFSTYERLRTHFVDKSLEPEFARLEAVADGEMQIVSRTQDDTKWIVAYLLDDGPVRYYLYDRTSGAEHYLFSNQTKLEGLPLVKMHPVVIDSRDGLKLVSYLSLPAWADPDGDGRPNEPLPMVVDVHGGPWSRVSWGYNPWHQWLANRGYAVLSVNFRGSTGFGKAFINAGNYQWGAKMHDDVIDATNWAIDNRIAQADKVAIMGGS